MHRGEGRAEVGGRIHRFGKGLGGPEDFGKSVPPMSILQKIAETKRIEVARLKRERGLSSLKEGARSQSAPRNFLKAVHRPGKLSLIGELKKASPSKGVLRADFQIEPLARAYAKAGAQALSVLTDIQYFQGDLSYLKKAKDVSGLPVL